MLKLLYQDEHYIAVYKPSGLLVHRSMIDRHETQFALQMARDLIGQRVYPRTPFGQTHQRRAFVRAQLTGGESTHDPIRRR